MTTDNFCFYLQNGLIQTGQTGGQQLIDTSPFSIPWFNHDSKGYTFVDAVLYAEQELKIIAKNKYNCLSHFPGNVRREYL